MTYCKTVDSENYEIFVSVEKKAKKGDYVVFFDDDFLVVTKVVEVIDELTAITSDIFFYNGLDVIDVKPYLEKRKKDIQKKRLISAMKEQIEIGKMRETLRKNANVTDEMAALYRQFEELEKGDKPATDTETMDESL